jgi:hypothetical protein
VCLVTMLAALWLKVAALCVLCSWLPDEHMRSFLSLSLPLTIKHEMMRRSSNDAHVLEAAASLCEAVLATSVHYQLWDSVDRFVMHVEALLRTDPFVSVPRPRRLIGESQTQSQSQSCACYPNHLVPLLATCTRHQLPLIPLPLTCMCLHARRQMAGAVGPTAAGRQPPERARLAPAICRSCPRFYAPAR